jgi:hypothetical protein
VVGDVCISGIIGDGSNVSPKITSFRCGGLGSWNTYPIQGSVWPVQH